MTIKATLAKLKEQSELSKSLEHTHCIVSPADLFDLIAHTESQDARIEELEAECARWIPYPEQVQRERDKWFGLGHIEVVDGQKYLLALPLPLPKPPTPATAALMGEGAKCECEPVSGPPCKTGFVEFHDDELRDINGCNNCGHDKACHQGAPQ